MWSHSLIEYSMQWNVIFVNRRMYRLNVQREPCYQLYLDRLMRASILLLLLVLVLADVPADKMTKLPGYGNFSTSIYSGYLKTANDSRQLHYVFVESVNGPRNSDPVTLWLNGGPGCSSMLGFIQEIGPYYLEDGKDYKQGDNLTLNEFSWHNKSNLLFLETPAGVGYSYNLDTKYEYNDTNTAQDNLNALQFFFKNFNEYSSNNFFIAGESYAGKYIPDLAVLIDKSNGLNNASKINLKGILVGNGVMSFEGGELEKSEAEYMIDHNFIDPELLIYYKISCLLDYNSAGCNYFIAEYEEDVREINPYNVYGYCFYNSTMITEKSQTETPKGTQSSTLKARLRKQYPNLYGNSKIVTEEEKKYNANAPCAFFDGMYSYFNLNQEAFHAKFPGMKWNGPCADNITYNIDLAGSMSSYRYLLSKISNYSITLYNGDWDDVVPYGDTLKNMKKLNLGPSQAYSPWFTGVQHSGFTQYWSGVTYKTVKGASHQVPQSKRAEALQMFTNIIQGHK